MSFKMFNESAMKNLTSLKAGKMISWCILPIYRDKLSDLSVKIKLY